MLHFADHLYVAYLELNDEVAESLQLATARSHCCHQNDSSAGTTRFAEWTPQRQRAYKGRWDRFSCLESTEGIGCFDIQDLNRFDHDSAGIVIAKQGLLIRLFWTLPTDWLGVWIY